MKPGVMLVLAALSSALAGCGAKTTQSAATETTDSVQLFKAGKGVWFSEETKKLFGLETAEVAERPMPVRVEKTAEVYRAAREGHPGGAVVRCSANEAKALTPGQPVLLGATTNSATPLRGTLAHVDAQAEAALGHVEALIEFADPAATLSAGKFVPARFEGGEAQSALVVPQPALLEAADGSYVYVVNGSYLTRTRVKAGARGDGFVAITDGLYGGDAVVVKGVEHLWLVELSALKGGTPCCAVPKKEGAK